MKVTHTYGLEVGQQVVIGIGDWMIPARVMNIIGNADVNYRIGMEWIRPESPAVAALVHRCCSD